KPSSPKPVKVYSAGIFHGPEKIFGSWMLEHPSLRIGTEGMIKKFMAHHCFPEYVQSSCGFAISIVPKLKNILRIAHNRSNKPLVTFHIRNDLGRDAPAGRIYIIGRYSCGISLAKILFSQIL